MKRFISYDYTPLNLDEIIKGLLNTNGKQGEDKQ